MDRIAMPAAAPADGAASSRWSDLPFDLLRDISSRLHVAADYVRFHAACKPWRDTLPPPPCRPAFRPLLLAPIDSTGNQTARCIFSPKSSRRSTAVEIPVRDRIWVISTGGGGAATAFWLLAASRESTSLVNPLSESVVAVLPPLPGGIRNRRWVKHAAGRVSGDDTIFLHGFAPAQMGYHTPIFVALLRSGSAVWTFVKPYYYVHPGARGMDTYSVTYRDGKIILWCNREGSWRIVLTDAGSTHGDMPRERSKKFQCLYTVESHGELLVLCVQVKTNSMYYKETCYNGRAGDIDSLASALSVSVYALKKVEGGELHWVMKDSQSMKERVLFLGRPSSFAIEAAQLGMSGGCAYFVDRRSLYGGTWSNSPLERCRVFRYSFHDDTLLLVEQLPDKWNCEASMWFTPQPAISTTEEICDRLEALNRKAAKPTQQYGADFRIYVGNLSRKVDSYQLRCFFSKHGKVTDARVMCDRKTGHSRGFGFVTMATTIDDEPASAIAKIHGQSLDGRPLRVKFADQEL